jgi:hypothetical protein
LVLQHAAAFASPARQHVHCADALDADSSVNTRTINGASRPGSNDASKQQITVDVSPLVARLVAIGISVLIAGMAGLGAGMVALYTSGQSAVQHLDVKIEAVGKETDRKIEEFKSKIEDKIEDVKKEVNDVKKEVNDLKVSVERQRGFDEGRRFRWWPR